MGINQSSLWIHRSPRGERESKDGKAQTFPRQHMRFHVSFSLESRCLGKVWKGNLANARTSVRNLLSILHLPATRINFLRPKAVWLEGEDNKFIASVSE